MVLNYMLIKCQFSSHWIVRHKIASWSQNPSANKNGLKIILDLVSNSYDIWSHDGTAVGLMIVLHLVSGSYYLWSQDRTIFGLKMV